MNDIQPSNPTFEQALAELERIVHELEDNQTGLEEALDRYERGVRLIKQCHTQLRQAEQRILLLTAVDEAGQPVLKPFEHTATAGPGPGGRGQAAAKRTEPLTS